MESKCYNGSPEPEVYAKEVSEALLSTDFNTLRAIAEEILKSKKTDSTVFTAGNGGSAATAGHMINDLMKGCRVEGREGFKAVCLNDPNAVVTCLANDFSYEEVYEIELRTIARRGDILIVFSGSGNSPNIIRACRTAKEKGMTVIGFGGRDGGKMKDICDICLIAPTYSMEQIEDLHMFYVHSLICTLKDRLRRVWDVEIIRYPENRPEFAIFDFDGTVSLLREGWQPIMYNYFIDEIMACPGAPDREETRALVMDFVDKLTGKQTIFQCIHLRDEIVRLGGEPKDPLDYKREYLRRLLLHIKERHKALKNGGDAEPYLVPGVKDTLAALKQRGVKCFLTSGTDEEDVVEEAKLLGVYDFFESIHGATDANSTVCSKELVLRQLIEEKGLKGSGLLGFGDGYVEIELTKQAGGYAVAVATEEGKRDTSVNGWKRSRLIRAGADCVIPDFTDTRRLMRYIFGE